MRIAKSIQPVSPPATPVVAPITDAELVVMKVVWDRAPVTASGVVAALVKTAAWKPKTIHTLLTRLVQKGAVTAEKQGRAQVFRPLIAAADFQHAASRSFLGRMFDGEIAPFLACFLDRAELSPEEIAELRRLLDGQKPG